MTNPKFRQVGHASQRGLIERNGTVVGTDMATERCHYAYNNHPRSRRDQHVQA